MTETDTMVSSGPSSLPSPLSLGRARVTTIGAVLLVLGVSLVQIIRADRLCSRLALKTSAGQDAKVHEFTYASDDAYLHLALARRMALTQPNDEMPYPAAAALAESPSPAWTMLLAGVVKLFGGGPPADDPAVHRRIEWLSPLILNLLVAGLLIMLVGHALRFDVHRSAGLLCRLLVVAVCVPIPLLVLTGTEHLAHAFVLLLAVSAGVELIERERLAARRLLLSMIWMALAVSLRYESLAVVVALVLWAWIRRRLGRLILTVMAGFGAAIGLSIYLGTHKQPWIPFPVQAWAQAFTGDGSSNWALSVVDHAVANIREALLPAALVMIAAVMLWSRREHQSSPDSEDRIRVGWLFVFLVVGVTYLLIARTSEQFQYTAYLVPLGGVAILRALANRPGAKWAPSAPVGLRYTVMAVFCLFPLAVAAVPAGTALWNAPQACADVFLRNRNMAAFVRTYFREPTTTVAATELGALRYETWARVLDVNAAGRADDSSPLEQAQLLLLARRPGDSFSRPAGWGLVGGWGQDDTTGKWNVDVYASQRTAGVAAIAARGFGESLPGSLTKSGDFTGPSAEHDRPAATQPADK